MDIDIDTDIERRMRKESSKRTLGPQSLRPPPYTLNPTPHTLNPTPYTLHPTPYTLHPTPYTGRW